MATDLTRPDPGVVLDLIIAYRCSKTMFAAAGLGVFDALAAGPRSASALAQELGTHPEALGRLLDACAGLQLLRRVGTCYENTPAVVAYLTRSSPHRLLGYVNFSNEFSWPLWAHLEDAIREGSHRWKQTFGWDGAIFSHFFHTEESKREFLMGMHGYGLLSSPHVVAAFDLGRFQRLVDLGGATGHLAVAACRRYPALRAVVFDLPDAVPLARELVGATEVAERVEIVAGDFFTDPLPQGDLYAVGRILHDWTEAKIMTLLGKIVDRLPSGGALLIAEKILDEDRNGPRWAQMQDINMLIATEGKERTLTEYESLLHRAGFSEIFGCRTPSPLDAVLAIKH
jgi:acetylserotonin N-methyltransferase